MHGSILRGLRESAGLTRKQLAATVGCHWTYIGMIERGERNPPSFATACALWTAFGKHADLHPEKWDASYGELLSRVEAVQ